ncbi:hypothetical protein Droror1_Dr00017530 [Drosera rotundifolia]
MCHHISCSILGGLTKLTHMLIVIPIEPRKRKRMDIKPYLITLFMHEMNFISRMNSEIRCLFLYLEGRTSFSKEIISGQNMGLQKPHGIRFYKTCPSGLAANPLLPSSLQSVLSPLIVASRHQAISSRPYSSPANPSPGEHTLPVLSSEQLSQPLPSTTAASRRRQHHTSLSETPMSPNPAIPQPMRRSLATHELEHAFKQSSRETSLPPPPSGHRSGYQRSLAPPAAHTPAQRRPSNRPATSPTGAAFDTTFLLRHHLTIPKIKQ